MEEFELPADLERGFLFSQPLGFFQMFSIQFDEAATSSLHLPTSIVSLGMTSWGDFLQLCRTDIKAY